jgi:hypothetical protein
MGFHGRAATHNPKITMMPSVGWNGGKLATIGPAQWKCLFWSDESRFTIWQSDRFGA